MRRWILLAVLALLVTVSGCKSISHPIEKKQEPENKPISVPNGETAPFAS